MNRLERIEKVLVQEMFKQSVRVEKTISELDKLHEKYMKEHPEEFLNEKHR